MPISGTWIAFDNNSNFPFDKAFFIGKDKNGHSMFVGRGKHENDLLPGKFVLEESSFYVPYGGKEVKVECCDILLNDNFRWTTSSNGNIHGNAVIGGETSSGEELFIGRVTHDGVAAPGKIHPSHKTMYVPSAGGEHGYNSYEILVTSSPDVAEGTPSSGALPINLLAGTRSATANAPSTIDQMPRPIECSFVPVPAGNSSPSANVAKNNSSDIGWMIPGEADYQHPNIPSEKLIQCQMCCNQRIDGVFIPCGHCACYNCGSALSQCHKCGRGIDKVQRIYFA